MFDKVLNTQNVEEIFEIDIRKNSLLRKANLVLQCLSNFIFRNYFN